MDFGAFNNWGQLKSVAIRDVAAAFESEKKIEAEWRDLNYHSSPDYSAAREEYHQFETLLKASGAEVIKLPPGKDLTLDSIYTHDALVITPKGLVLPRMGKPQRRMEAEVNAAALKAHNFPIAGRITGAGKLEGGDLVWIDRHCLLAGIGYRTNLEGIAQLSSLAGDDVEILSFDMPHYKGPSDVFHLMSCLSPLDGDLALIYPPLMAARLIEFLKARGMRFVEVPEEEFTTMGCNVLALGPRHALMVEGNPITHSRLLEAGCKVETYKGYEISRKGEGGPTCMTRPLIRAHVRAHA